MEKQILPTGPGVVAVLDEPAPKNIFMCNGLVGFVGLFDLLY